MNILVIGEKLFTDYALQALDDTAHMVDVYYWDGTFGPDCLWIQVLMIMTVLLLCLMTISYQQILQL